MSHRRGNFWIGFIIGLLAALLAAALAVLFVPELRPIVGLQQKNTPSAPSAASTQTTDATQEVPTASENIRVTNPTPNMSVTSPLLVQGEARVFENTVSLRLTDEAGRILAETFTTADAPDIGLFGPFEISLSFSKPAAATGLLEVFEQSAKDGSEINKVSIPVSFE